MRGILKRQFVDARIGPTPVASINVKRSNLSKYAMRALSKKRKYAVLLR
jgi:hypothetical protein